MEEEIKNTLEPTDLVVKQDQIMTIVDEAPAETYSLPLVVKPVVVSDALESRQHDIKDFLSREILVGDFSFTNTNSRNDTIFSLDFPSVLIDQGMVAEKILGFKFIRGDILVKIVLNKMPFQSGILKVGIFPMRSVDDEFNSQLESFEQFSGLQGVDLNLQTNKTFEIRIPFVFPLTAWDLIDRPVDWANLQCRVYSPLRSGSGTDNVSVTVFAHFDPATLDLSMPVSTVSARSAQLLSEFYGNESRRRLQMGIAKEKEEASKPGSISTAMKGIGMISQVASGIPGLGAIAGVANVASGIVGSIASSFGFSKPLSEQIPTHVRPIYAKGMNNSDFVDIGHNMALSSVNSLDVASPLFGTDIDEMSFAHIMRIPQFFESFEYSTSSVRNRLIYSTAVNPMATFQTFSGTSDLRVVRCSNMGLIASCFKNWRGSINYTFKFSKTSFHSGRLMLVWFNQTDAIFNTYEPQFAKNYSIMMDLNENMEFDVNIPYIQAQPWFNNQSALPRSDGQSNGRIGIYVINTLQVAGLASNTIEVMVETRAGNDMFFAVPRAPQYKFGFLSAQATTSLTTEVELKLTHAEIPFVTGGFITYQASPWIIVEAKQGVDLEVKYEGENLQCAPSSSGTWLDFDRMVYGGTVTSGSMLHVEIGFYLGSTPVASSVFDFIGPPPETCGQWIRQKYPPVRSNRRLQVGRDESYLGNDGINIASRPEKCEEASVNLNTVGESVTSVRQLIKRYSFGTSARFIESGGHLLLAISPFNPNQSIFPNKFYGQPFVNFFLPAFRFYTGSRRIKVFITKKATTGARPEQLTGLFPVVYVPGFSTTDAATAQYGLSMFNVANSTVIYNANEERFLELSIPYYNKNPFVVCGDKLGDSPLEQNISTVLIDCGVVPVADKPLYDFKLYEAAGEDFRFGSYLSAPNLVAVGTSIFPDA